MSDKENKSSSSSKPAVGNNKALMVVALRNKFFYMLYRYSSLVFLTSLIGLISSIAFLVFFSKQPVAPQYVPVKEDGTYFDLEPLSQCKPDAEVQKFVMAAMKKLYKYDYINYADQIQEASQYFTIDGWNEYLNEYSISGILTSVKENKWISTIEVNKVPLILDRKEVNGLCTWEVQTDATVIYIGEKAQRTSGELYFRVVRNSVINNSDGLGIVNLVFKPK